MLSNLPKSTACGVSEKKYELLSCKFKRAPKACHSPCQFKCLAVQEPDPECQLWNMLAPAVGETQFVSQRSPTPSPVWQTLCVKQAETYEDVSSSRDDAIQTLKSAGQRQSTKQAYVPPQAPLLSRKVKHRGRAIFDRSVDVDNDDEEEGEGQIIRYNESIIHLGSCTTVRGTVCSDSYVWKQLGMLFVVAIGVALHTHWNGFLFIFPSEIIMEDYVPSEFALLDSILTLQSFLLGLCVSNALTRWWTIRDNCIGGLWGCIDDLCLVLGTTFAEQTNSSSLATTRSYSLKERYLRLALASFALLFMEARGDFGGDTVTDVPANAAFQGIDIEIGVQNSVASNERIALQVLVDRKLLSRKQADALEGECSKSQVIWCWIAHMFTVAQREGRLPDGHKLWWFHDKCTIARGSIGRTFAYIDTQVCTSQSKQSSNSL